MPFIAGAGILGGLGLIGSLGGAALQSNAANNAAQMQMQEFEQIRQSLSPYLRSGHLATDRLDQLLGLGSGKGTLNSFLLKNPMSIIGHPNFTMKDFHESPGYKFSLAQGENAIQSAATPGQGDFSGATLKALQGYGTGLANQEFQQDYTNWINNYWNKYNAVTGRQNQAFNMLDALKTQGQNAAVGQASFGQQAVTNAGNFGIQGANSLSAGLVGGTNAIGGALLSPQGGYNNTLLAALLGGQGANSGGYSYSGGANGNFDAFGSV